jgi:hypothetical protein
MSLDRTMNYLCKSCGGDEPVQDGVPCSACGRRHFVLKADPGQLKITGSPVGMIVEGDPNNPLGRRVESRPASGGASDSCVAADGSFQVTLSGALDRGRAGESHVIKILFNKLHERDSDIYVDDGARDHFGEDGILVVNGRRMALQIVTVPKSPAVWKGLNVQNTAAVSGDRAAAVSIIRDAIVAKSVKAKGTILALDLTHIGAIVNRTLVEAYLAAFGDPVAEFSFEAVWLVGPTARSTIELR